MPKFVGRQENVVLVADDNMFIRFLVKKWLGGDATIIEVSHGAEVVEAFQKHHPDIVFLDIHLPGKSGKDILKELMALDREAYVIMLSADSNKENVIHAVRHGARAFITKPFTRETLTRYYTKCPSITQVEGGSAAADKVS